MGYLGGAVAYLQLPKQFFLQAPHNFYIRLRIKNLQKIIVIESVV